MNYKEFGYNNKEEYEDAKYSHDEDEIKLERCNNMKEEKEMVGEGIGFERIRRVTGYLSGDVKRFNNAKRAEERDRVKHSKEGEIEDEGTNK